MCLRSWPTAHERWWSLWCDLWMLLAQTERYRRGELTEQEAYDWGLID